MATMHLRIGWFAVTVQWYPSRVGWAVHKWKWEGRESWCHGTAYLGRIKVIW